MDEDTADAVAAPEPQSEVAETATRAPAEKAAAAGADITAKARAESEARTASKAKAAVDARAAELAAEAARKATAAAALAEAKRAAEADDVVGKQLLVGRVAGVIAKEAAKPQAATVGELVDSTEVQPLLAVMPEWAVEPERKRKLKSKKSRRIEELLASYEAPKSRSEGKVKGSGRTTPSPWTSPRKASPSKSTRSRTPAGKRAPANAHKKEPTDNKRTPRKTGDAGSNVEEQSLNQTSDEFADPASIQLTFAEITKPGVIQTLKMNPLCLERYLTDSAFVETFDMSKEAFEKLLPWKKVALRKRVHMW